MHGFDDQARRMKQFVSRAAWGPNSIEEKEREEKEELANQMLPEFANTEQRGSQPCCAQQHNRRVVKYCPTDTDDSPN